MPNYCDSDFTLKDRCLMRSCERMVIPATRSHYLLKQRTVPDSKRPYCYSNLT